MSAEIFYLHRPAVERLIQKPFRPSLRPDYPPFGKPKNHAEEIANLMWKLDGEKRDG